MMDRFQIFEFKFNDDELEEEFHNFFYKYGLTPLFTNEHRAPGLSVSWTEARSVINNGGWANVALKEFADYLAMSNDNKSYEEALFKILYESRSLRGLVNKIKRIMQEIDLMDENHKFNMWNVVWYTKKIS